MSLSYAITHVTGNSTEDVTLPVAEKSTMVAQSSTTDPKTGRITETYIVSSGDPNHSAKVTFSVDPQNAKNLSRYGVVNFSTWLTQTDSVTGVITWWPISASISFTVPNAGPTQLADFNNLMACVFSYTYQSVTTKVRDTTWLQSLLFGSPVVK